MQKLKHPHIISYGAVFEDAGSMYVQMDYFENGSLRHWVTNTSPSHAQKRKVLRQVLLAINCIHSQKIVHCDLKGENVLITDDETPRLCDFEMSKNLEGSASTFIGGTRGFVAPEVISGGAKYSAASDMYAFGVIVLNTFDPPALGQPYPHTAETFGRDQLNFKMLCAKGSSIKAVTRQLFRLSQENSTCQ